MRLLPEFCWVLSIKKGLTELYWGLNPVEL